jgi:uncharacterized protein YjiS (DUF1127 family)
VVLYGKNSEFLDLSWSVRGAHHFFEVFSPEGVEKMNGLSDVRLSLRAEELLEGQRAKVTSPIPGLSRWGLMWHRLNTRKALLQIDEDQLRDIGLSPEQARNEALKPFWRS